MISEIQFKKFGETDGWAMVWNILKTITYVKEGRDIEIGWEAILGKRKPNSKGSSNGDSTGGLAIVVKGLIPGVGKGDNTRKRVDGFILK